MKYPRGLDSLQKISITLMGVLVLLTFVGANMQAVLWQSSKWLVGTVLPAVVVDLTNDERAENSAKPLRRSATLDAAAKLKAQHMAKNEYFAHYAPDGTSPWYWFDASGYVYAHAGENLAIHFTDSYEVVEAWMDSPTHRKNIVDAKFTEIGVGTAKGEYEGYETVYVVQLFGTPAVPPPSPVAKVQPPVPAPTQVALVETEPTNVLASEDSLIEPTATTTESVATTTNPAANVAQYSDKETQLTAAPVSQEANIKPVPSDDVVVLESLHIATSSGLAVANIVEENNEADSSGIAGIATRPHLVLQIIYGALASIVVLLLLASLFIEMRRVHPVQMAYSAGMLGTMALLLWVHTVLIHGAVIV